MFDKTDIDRNDPLGERLHTAYGKMLPPPALEQAVRNGVPYSPKINTKIHVRKFARAIVSYAVCIALLIGGVYLVSRLMGEQEPVASDPPKTTTTSTSQEKPTDKDVPQDDSPEAIYNALLSADEVIVTVTDVWVSNITVDSTIDGIEIENVQTYTRSGPLVMFEQSSSESLVEPVYCDLENGKQYVKMIDDENWTVLDSDCADWQEFVETYILGTVPQFFENDNYEIKDSKYVFTQKAINKIIAEYRSTGHIDTITHMVGEQFEMEITFETTDEGAVWSYVISGEEGSLMETRILVQFVETQVVLPEVAE